MELFKVIVKMEQHLMEEMKGSSPRINIPETEDLNITTEISIEMIVPNAKTAPNVEMAIGFLVTI